MSGKSAAERAGIVKEIARGLGFDLVGVARAKASQWGEAYRAWLGRGEHGAMEYLARNVEERLDVTKKFPWAKSVVSVGVAYWQAESEKKGDVEGEGENEGEVGRVARYAWGRDYHRVIGNKLQALERELRARLAPEVFEARVYTDTGPLMDREFAVQAGLGWMGKHTLVIHPKHGSWFLLGEMVTSLEMAADEMMTDHCGTCSRCVDACPTHAIGAYAVDAVKCISYQTLENRGTVPVEMEGAMREAGFIVGCDICQEVCPFNRQPLATREVDFLGGTTDFDLRKVLHWQEQDWDKQTRGKAHRRAKWEMWLRNARILLRRENEGT